MAKSSNQNEAYYKEIDIKNLERLREVEQELPAFCKQFFRGIAQTTGTRTRVAYAYDLRTFFDWLHENNPELARTDVHDYPIEVLDQIGKEDIEEFIDWSSYYKKDGRTYTNNEVGKSRKLSAIRSMYHYFYVSEMIDRNVSELVSMPKKHDKPIIRLEPDEVARLLDQVEDGTGLTKAQMRFHGKTKVRDTALITLLLGTGIRVSECVGLDLTDVNFDENAIKVHRKGGYDAVVYFGDEVRQMLQEYMVQRRLMTPREGDENALFLSLKNSRMSVSAVERLVKKYASNVTTLKKITPHKLRSTYGTSLYRETGDIYLVAEVLGHKDVNTTRQHYAALEEDRRRSAANIVRLREDPPVQDLITPSTDTTATNKEDQDQ